MQPQLNLNHKATLTGKPSTVNSDPMFWICEIRLLKQMKAGDDNEVRSIKFKKGMNIVWAESPAIYEVNKQRFAGHASGKTTLCRIIRYVLGESRFAVDQVAQSIRLSFPDGGVIAHIKLNGESWCVGRTFTGFRKDWSIKSNNLDLSLPEKTDKKSYHEFRQAIEGLQPQISTLKVLPSGEQLTLWHIFPWFTRDQDCQFTRLHEWRDNPVTHSESPALTIEQAMLAMRSTIEPDLERETKLLQEQDELAAKLKQNRNDQSIYERIVCLNRERIKEVAGEGASDSTVGDLFLLDIENKIKRSLETDGYLPGEQEHLAELQNQRDTLSAEYKMLAEQYAGALEAFNQKKRELEQRESATEGITSTFDELDEIEFAAQFIPTRQYCCVPLELAIKKGCKLATSQTKPYDFESKATLSKLTYDGAELEKLRNLVRDFYAVLIGESKNLKNVHFQLESAELKLKDYKAKIEPDRKGRLLGGATTLEAIRQLKASKKKLKALQDNHEQIIAAQSKCSAQLLDSRNKSKEALEKASHFFSEIVHFVLGDEVTGGLKLVSGRIEPHLEFKGALTSAALNAVKNICFDLTALTLSIEGFGTHPRFLIHDGPRVSDLAANIFAYYFKYAEFLEKSADGNANFQYIITTTEPPPEEYRKKPWLICKLDASNPDTRLFGCDLV